MNVNDMKKSNTSIDIGEVISLLVTESNNNHVILIENS